ncbi:helix-turn-helix domain-containing protein [Mycobacterium sp. KBS0706]|uniref:helix-turn-helix domain-containing protein n=1 Tax=Mycobacterium sp. KBS0706 TaxID=2578109 RepID=UPI00110F6F78|nr:helix-turn-helix domain-containing protein [Mycobacterium sp. KBS0706]TSD84531.1 helix-turn-helix domain-containing protein [Mycobacterium sp. KBS0706]
MNALLEKPDTIVPSEEDAKLAAEFSRILASKRPEEEFRVHLNDGQELLLPKGVRQFLTHLLTEISHGNAVTLIPIHAEMTTQEAADYLNVSRPHLVKLLEAGEIKFHKVGSHRRVRFGDLRTYKEQVAVGRAKALDELAAQAQELGMGY